MSALQKKSAKNSKQNDRTEQPNDKLDIDFEPFLTVDQACKAESEESAKWLAHRHTMLMLLTHSGESMAEMLTLPKDKKVEAYYSIMERLGDYEQHLKSSSELARVAINRLFVVTQHVADNEAEATEQA